MSDDFVPETEEGEEEMILRDLPEDSEEKKISEKKELKKCETKENIKATTSLSEKDADAEAGFSRRLLNEKWYGKYSDGVLLEFIGEEWKPVNSDESEFLEQLWMEQEETEKMAEKFYKWNEEKGEWEPKEAEVDEDFIAQYQANYGVQEEHLEIYKKMDEEIHAKVEQKVKEKEARKEQKKRQKMGGEPEPDGWIDTSDKVHAVYVSNLPLELNEDEFKEFMQKCGVIQVDPRNNKPKIKLYRTPEGDNKGDGRCVYMRGESVELALSILDGMDLKGKKVKIEEAHFELKGDFDPTKKKRKLTAIQKKRAAEQKNKIFEWKPDKPRNYRPPSDCTVIFKNMFTLDEMMKNAALLLDLKADMQTCCEKYGTVKKVVVYDHNPEGVVSVTFTSTDESDMAVKFMNGRAVGDKKITAELWDGKSRYRVEETPEEAARRQAAYEEYLASQEPENVL